MRRSHRINRVTVGWFAYFRHCTWNIFDKYDGMIRSRLRRQFLKRHRKKPEASQRQASLAECLLHGAGRTSLREAHTRYAQSWRETTNWRAVCGRIARTVRREGSPAQPDFPTPIPTLLSMAGLPKPAEHVVNGQDLTPLLCGEPFVREQPLVFHYPHWSPQGGSPHSAILIDDLKLIYEYATASWELYDLGSDIGETTNLSAVLPVEHALYSYLLSDELLSLTANYPRDNLLGQEQPPEPLYLPGDVNLDGSVNLLDVAPFVDLLSGGQYQVEGDLNFDSTLNLLDVDPFVAALSGN